jgi:hypothetical protein
MVLLKPNSRKSTVDDGTFTNGVTVKYKLEKENEATEDLVLKMLVDQWVKLYLVIDAESVAEPVPKPVETLAEARK